MDQSLSNSPVIALDHVGVRYRTAQEKIPSFKEYAIRWIKRDIKYQSFWALKDVSFSVSAGEVFGVVGVNGAGKSTLLKVIARVLKPVTGRVRIWGRVSPLLELGAGFHQELTGRENIYLNGAFLGFSKKDLDSRFQRIVDFAGLGDFIDAPLRTYSTGMVARLGFSVATDVRPEILIVDEILGVGDADFQRRSFERIQKFQAEGTTILLVSHSSAKITEMCSKALWLDRGKTVMLDSADTVIGKYLEFTTRIEAERLKNTTQAGNKLRWGSGAVEITAVRIVNDEGEEQKIFQTGDSLTLEMDYTAHENVDAPIFGIAVFHQNGAKLTGPNTKLADFKIPKLSGSGTVTYTVPYLPLLNGLYHVSVAAVDKTEVNTFDMHNRAYQFRVINQDSAIKETNGLMTFQGQWHLDKKL